MRRMLLMGALLAPAFGHAYGPEGHLIAGALAEPLLCSAARAQIRALDRDANADLRDFAELGLWADRIRGTPRWRHTAPWHYMNIEADAANLAAAERAVRAFEHPPEGDVLWAIEHFSGQLTDERLPAAARADALRFLVHFVVDIHQPLHVGRASDRGGNTIDVRYGDNMVNLHRFWDTDVIALARESPARYAYRLGAAGGSRAAGAPLTWAAESPVLRRDVYAGVRPGGTRSVLGDGYLARARALTDRRLREAAQRLAMTLNGLWCG